MTAVDGRDTGSTTDVHQVTTGPIMGSTKVHREIDTPEGLTLRVPQRRVELSNGSHFDLYDTSGPYTDDSALIDVHSGLPRTRQPWVDSREPVNGAVTQLAHAKAGTITAEMRFVAAREGMDPEYVRQEVGLGVGLIVV